ncbi:MSMEG_0565 family glycosyltransferase [Aeromicrobium chenweiae]|uniref:MSMEG_0565 family glycosyltransferase n=1 Tax=Aeromicrobium chenweiae TaxID=2079793 RepID=A0A2S0WLU7_9ACTN|nr:MSMEG_0565 family glycosyltransferase [Aeromicrobium chenweiae]AWB92296.1 MSMEG_0565 family glycosyltransferase [Aeromicrobium chenweiae]TGN31420.1 MSMEG_0565 family glycosyltransferase [Aeromicrobium chenweiae]
MRIALLTYSTKPRGGVVHTLALAEALSRAGADVDVWTLGRGGDATFYRPVDPAVGVHAVPFPEQPGEDVGARIQRSIAVLRDAFTPDAYDVVHAQDCISANAALPCLRTIHHLDTFTTPALAACHERAVVDPIGHVCVSESVAAEVKAGWGLSPTVIPNGVDAERFARAAGPHGAERRAAWSDTLGPYVLALGGIEPRKGSIDLLEAYALMRRRRPDVRLVFAGGETLFDYRDYRAAFERRAAQLGVDHVMLGVVDEEELPALVAAASAMAFVSTKEGFGLAAMEALAAGVPVVARDLPVLREVFGGAVRFASEPMAMAGSLASVLEDPPDPEIGRALAASYTWEAAAAAHLELYSTCT